ncbi:LOW QUALITY PROTEIN: hypothetical protein NC653_008145 [Populus alba x Populus x berolinensis]|uniref:Uncharacterized protein n=1 Tax=Populus alba x Populus x berolinensis TaxID=444605 RepID=A0AAD6R5Z7_9ROSI|nr:LOW QUALITY PROTEIN: hypothetical protein NC653_008145 [Populus alba x Populus x berolinensis]
MKETYFPEINEMYQRIAAKLQQARFHYAIETLKIKQEEEKKPQSLNMSWLDSKKPNSVVCICFGSMANFIASQLKEIATDLEASGHQFI